MIPLEPAIDKAGRNWLRHRSEYDYISSTSVAERTFGSLSVQLYAREAAIAFLKSPHELQT
jgi:hypothetical protein